MPTLYLHCGLHKTGTTSLQKALHDNRDWLARQGVLYPETGLTDDPHAWGHHAAALALHHPGPGRRMWEALRAEADASGAERVVISSEALSDLPVPGLPALRPFRMIATCFTGWDIRMVCYLRPQAEMLASLYVQQVKAGGETRDICDFMVQAAPKLDYAGWLTGPAQVFGRAAILLRRYQPDRLHGGDTVSDFLHLLGLDPETGFRRPRASLNAGLTARGLDEMLAANRRFAGAPRRLARARARIVAAHPAPAFAGADPLGPELRRAVAALYALRNRHLARTYLGEPDGLFFPGEGRAGPDPAGQGTVPSRPQAAAGNAGFPFRDWPEC